MHIVATRPQRTVARTVTLEGIGLVTGAAVRVRFHPASPDSGIVFYRRDQPGAPAIHARVSAAIGTCRRTTLGTAGQGITLVEHLLAALAGLRIDNCWVELDGPEPPGLDGSAAAYVRLLLQAGVVVQNRPRCIWAVQQPLTVRREGATLTLYPPPPGSAELRLSYLLDYGTYGPIPQQRYTVRLTPGEFAREVANCRTFVTAAEARQLREQGIGRHLRPADIVVFGNRGPLDNRLRFADEPARHKILDLIGDLALFGADLAGHVVAYRSGHTLNVELVRRLCQMQTDAECGRTTACAA
ncbi:MAG: UDP-3-O-acyl-N-acetylglucosamine deacetylase [Gemmataceae bacterium]|nr:UDP-3-O-acyl-N-acetylglucosamine deacetylase [Gemmataceae bacterium]MDW8243706.1 UDP-3-O-acyl-N-acetylglucosamine deacetylase [Thermogemmata sp.]